MTYAIRWLQSGEFARGAGSPLGADVLNRPTRDLLLSSGYLEDGSNFDGFARRGADSQTIRSAANSGDGNLFFQFGTGLRTDGTAQTTEVQLRRNAQGFAQVHFHNAAVHEWKIGTDATGQYALWNNLHAITWATYQPDAAPALPGGGRIGRWQDFKGNVHQDGQIVQDVLWDTSWVSTSLSGTTPASSQNAWITKATIDANDTTTRQFRAFYGWTQYRGSGVSPNTSVQGGLFYGETAENFTGQIASAIGVVGIGSRLVAGTGIIRDHIGGQFIAFTAGGPSTNLWGSVHQILAFGTSAVATVRGITVDTASLSGTTTVSGDLCGVYVSDVAAWGGVVSGTRYAMYCLGGDINLQSGALRVAGTKVIGARATGWSAGTGTPNLGAFAADTATAVQAAQRVLALEQLLRTHGLMN